MGPPFRRGGRTPPTQMTAASQNSASGILIQGGVINGPLILSPSLVAFTFAGIFAMTTAARTPAAIGRNAGTTSAAPATICVVPAATPPAVVEFEPAVAVAAGVLADPLRAREDFVPHTGRNGARHPGRLDPHVMSLGVTAQALGDLRFDGHVAGPCPVGRLAAFGLPL